MKKEKIQIQCFVCKALFIDHKKPIDVCSKICHEKYKILKKNLEWANKEYVELSATQKIKKREGSWAKSGFLQ